MTFALGVLCMKYSVQITDQFSGKIDLAEKYFGSGIGAGTYTWWKLFGLIVCVLSVLYLFNKLSFSYNTPITEPAAMIQMFV